MNQKNTLDVCICEPFLISGLLPTLAPAILKSELKLKGYNSKIYYPSLCFFVNNHLNENKWLLELVDDIPLQIVDFFFSENEDKIVFEELKKNKNPLFTDERIMVLFDYRKQLANQLDDVVKDIASNCPLAVCCSLTFGGYNYTNALFKRLKKKLPNVRTIVGGSCCTIQHSKEIIDNYESIDFVVCDETGKSLIRLIDCFAGKEKTIPDCVTSKEKVAETFVLIDNMNEIPCPNFDDYFSVAKQLNLKTEKLTLPYEISRGCWWCERKPCVMCGFYGTRNKYIYKDAKKVFSDLEFFKETYGISKIRFSDLVQPKEPYLKKLQPLSHLKMNLFWEIRPDVSEEEIILLKNIGLTFSQIGLESFSTSCLKKMNKGTTGIYNIYILILAESYKIDLLWNYLYGFPWDEINDYANSTQIMPFLYHLQPPIPRKVWINKYSDWFNQLSENDGLFEFENFQDNNKKAFTAFFDSKICNSSLNNEYSHLIHQIEEWRKAKAQNFSISMKYDMDGVLHILKNYGKEEEFVLEGVKKQIYEFFLYPGTVEQCFNQTQVQREELNEILGNFVQNKIMLKYDGYFLSTAVRNTAFRWTPISEQVMVY